MNKETHSQIQNSAIPSSKMLLSKIRPLRDVLSITVNLRIASLMIARSDKEEYIWENTIARQKRQRN